MSGELATLIWAAAFILVVILIFGGKKSSGISVKMELLSPFIAVAFALGMIYLAGLFMGMVK